MSPLMFATIWVGLALLFGLILPYGALAAVLIRSIKRSQRAIDRMDAQAEQAELDRKERQSGQRPDDSEIHPRGVYAMPEALSREVCDCQKVRPRQCCAESEARLRELCAKSEYRLRESHAKSEALLLARIRDLERVQLLLIAETSTLQAAVCFGEKGRQYLLRQEPKDYRYWQKDPLAP